MPAGSGRRFGGTAPKQYLKLHHQPIIVHSINRLFALPLSGCVIAISPDDTLAQTLDYQHGSRLHFVSGGSERMDSVLAGLDFLQDCAKPSDWVLVHDVARPCIAEESLNQLFETLIDDAVGGILAIPVRDTLKKVDDGHIVETVSRDDLWQAQTPQMFRFGILRAALIAAKQRNLNVTDEASAVELAGFSVKVVKGRMDNIKVTYADDLALAEAIFQAHHIHK
ncbi:MAG: 2-C-methyl-D-erythritol 4-phosphate cytidylyltransferase [Candidatus Saccharibacteria bacterium]|nr:2-C-methyl-D-erythritol 4-phosphate cytidylyltransferase [Moraxellaceae bacterium]